MRSAIYARKSTSQADVAAEAKSVTRQIERCEGPSSPPKGGASMMPTCIQ